MTTPTRETTALNRAVAAQIRSILTIRRMRQSVLAKKMGVTEVWLSRRLREIQSLSLDDVEAICRALNVAPVDLVAVAVQGTWQTTAELVPLHLLVGQPMPAHAASAKRPRDTRPAGRPGNGLPDAPGIRRTRPVDAPSPDALSRTAA